MAQRTALGKGLEALLGDKKMPLTSATEAVEAIAAKRDNPSAINEIAIEKIIPNPYQPRLTFDETALQELSDSIRNLGIIQPLTLREMPDGRYQIISGERRYRASKAAGLATVPAYVRKADDAAMLEMAIVENIQRENLDAIETALGFQRLIDECNLTQEAMALRVGKNRATVTNFLRLLRLTPEVQKAVKDGAISAGHARTLIPVEDAAAQVHLCAQAIKNDWSVRTMEEKVKKFLEGPKRRTRQETSEKFTPVLDFFAGFGGSTTVRECGRKGTSITVKFKNADDMEKFISAAGKMNTK